MNVYQKKYLNLLENKNHLTVVSQAHNTIESLETNVQDAFTVESIPPQFYMQRMGQLIIPSYGRGRYDLNYYNNQESLSFPGKIRIFKTQQEQQESFEIMPKKKKRNIIQVPTYFRLLPKVKKYNYKPQQNESLIFPKKERLLKLKNENNFIIQRKKRFENLFENINDIKLKSDGKYFFNKPVLKKKSNLEVEYLVIKAPLKMQYTGKLLLEQKPKKTRYDDIKEENKFNIYYNMLKPKTFPLEQTNISNNNNFLIPHKPKQSSFKGIVIDNQSNINLFKQPKDKNYQLSIDILPFLYIPEWPGKRYCSVGMEDVTYIGNLRPEFCLEVEPTEDMFIPNVYDMLLIQNFWDNLEMKSFRICLRPLGYNNSNRSLNNKDEDNKENISENKEIIINNDEKKEEKSISISFDKSNDNIIKDSNTGKESGKMKFNLKNLLVKKNA